MADEQLIVESLQQACGLAAEALRIARPRRIFAQVAPLALRSAIEHARTALGFAHLCAITGIDEDDGLGLIYHLARADGTMLNLKTSVPAAQPAHASVCDLFPCALLYERELVDLFGAQITGLPPGARYPLPDDWPEGEHPLRKDWQPGGAATAAAPGANAAAPSAAAPTETEGEHADR
jgi:Ni,Fe-hydrogenase III component G